MHDPLDTLLRALKTAWDAAPSLASIDGPYRDDKPASAAAGLGYAVIRCDESIDAGWSSHATYWDHSVAFEYRAATPELAAAGIGAIKAVFDSPSTAITLDEGQVTHRRPFGSAYTYEDKSVYVAVARYEFRTSQPHTA